MDPSMLINEGVWLDRVDNGDSRSIEAMLSRAVNRDHPCKDYAGCDIARARAEGYTYVAAWLLTGATECPTIEALIDMLPEGTIILYPEPRRFKEWLTFHRTYGRKCPDCEHYMYAGLDYEPARCSNCYASMTTTAVA